MLSIFITLGRNIEDINILKTEFLQYKDYIHIVHLSVPPNYPFQ